MLPSLAKPEEDPAKAANDALFEKLFKARKILVTGGVNDEMAHRVTSLLLSMAEESDAPIDMFISSPGGHVESGDMIYDMIKYVTPEVRTIGSGWVASAGALIFVGAKKENRFCLPNTRFLLHQPSGGAGGMASDIAIQAKQIVLMRERLNKIFSDETGQPIKRIEEDTHRDFWMSAEEAIEYGMVSKIISSETEIK